MHDFPSAALDRWLTTPPEDKYSSDRECYQDEADDLNLEELCNELGEEESVALEKYGDVENATDALRERYVEERMSALYDGPDDFDNEPDDYFYDDED